MPLKKLFTISDRSGLNYMPQLDTLRAMAVFLVLLEHWFQGEYWFKIFPTGMIGVTLFFVLSGYLISEILMRSRNDAEANKHTRAFSIRQFYIRRTLRIFPIYYITLVILLIFNIENIRHIFGWFLFYVSNIYFFKIQNWAGSLSHLWTLSVEEQFYLIWPFVILFIKKKHLLNAIIFITFIGPAVRAYLFLTGSGTEVSISFDQVLTPTCMDCFGLGALLAYFRTYVDRKFNLNNLYGIIMFVVSAILFVIILLTDTGIFGAIVLRTIISILSLYLIAGASIGFGGVARYVLQNPVLLYLGKISYGLYLFHNFVPAICRSFGIQPIPNPYLNFLLQLAALVSIASLSWYLIEKPINNLKRHFSYT